ncbi:hypothetical protein B0H16DRAFT_1491350 [Mycena metata]|uniref:Uncharacterized protein n=1 Tax=Mycena metata TaxID=1033252 RepID=A0AAD7KG98_9AGAR|nr:hypothetical protein B0H16DRAFT_1491350 [Mycena metata]
MNRLLRHLIPSKLTTTTWIIVFAYFSLRSRYPGIQPIFRTLSQLVLYSTLYLIAGGYLLAGFISLLSLLLSDTDPELPDAPTSSGAEPSLTHPPHDAESLVSQSDVDQLRGVRGLLSRLAAAFIFAALAFFVASVLRPRGSGLAGTYQVLTGVARHTGLIGTIFIGPPLALSAPLILLRVMCRPLLLEPHKSAWKSAAALYTRIYISAFGCLLVIEALVSFAPKSSQVVTHLMWQGPILSYLLYFLSLAMCACGILWVLTDQTGMYLLDRGLIYLSLTLPPRSRIRPLVHWAQWIVVPVCMVFNEHIYNAAAIPEGLTSAAILIAQLFGAVFALFLLDLVVYWAYFFWKYRHSAIDTMTVTLVQLALYDSEGRLIFKKVRSDGSSDVEVLAGSDEKLKDKKESSEFATVS